jgi:hypothetical protein
MRPDDRDAMSMDALLTDFVRCSRIVSLSVLLGLLTVLPASAQMAPVLNTVFPCGGQTGSAFEVSVTGSHLESVQKLASNLVGFECELLAPNRFRVTIPATALPGQYDLWAAGENGLSSPRTFSVGRHPELLEVEPNDIESAAMSVLLNTVVNGQLDKPADVDRFRFQVTKGQRVIIECSAERIDSRLRAVLEVFDCQGRRLAVNRGYFGIDPLIDFVAPADGFFVVRIQDLISSGGPEFYYRLEFDTQPRVLFARPSVIPRGQSTRVTLFGWNLPAANVSGEVAAVIEEQSGPQPELPGNLDSQRRAGDFETLEFETLEVEIPASLAQPSPQLPIHLQPSQAVTAANSFAYYPAGSHAPVMIGLSDIPVSLDQSDNHSPDAAQVVAVPCELSGQLAEASEQDWFAVDARRGEVLHLEAFGQRISSPVDLQISIHDSEQQALLAQFSDQSENHGDEFSTTHLDPVGRWVCPGDGRYFVVVRNLNRSAKIDARRIYQLRIRREEADFQVVAIPATDGVRAINIPQGGRQIVKLIAVRQRAYNGAIRVSARDLPRGIECPDVWFGPGVNQATMVISADPACEKLTGQLNLEATGDAEPNTLKRIPHQNSTLRHDVLFGTIVRAGTPNGWGRLVSVLPFAVAGSAPLRISADAHEPLEHQLYGTLTAKHFQGSGVDVAVQIERQDASHQADVRISAEGLPDQIKNQITMIPAGQTKGYVTFELPLTLPTGHYSFVIRAETTVSTADGKTQNVVGHSSPVVIDVQPAAFDVDVDPFAVTKARRGDTIQISYSSRRRNGFIGKMHTEIAAPGVVTDVPGLLGRGETFTGQTETGSLQIVVNKDAPLGPQRFLRLFTVGVVEDEPMYFGSHFLSLEIVE